MTSHLMGPLDEFNRGVVEDYITCPGISWFHAVTHVFFSIVGKY